jgi:hypothetical protein
MINFELLKLDGYDKFLLKFLKKCWKYLFIKSFNEIKYYYLLSHHTTDP